MLFQITTRLTFKAVTNVGTKTAINQKYFKLFKTIS